MSLSKICLCASLALVLVSPAIAADKSLSTYFPPTEEKGGWRTLLPESGEPDAAQKAKIREKAGIDWDKLTEAWKHNAAAEGGTGLLVIRKGHVVGEWYHWAPSSIGGKAPADFGADRQAVMKKLTDLEKTTAKADVIAQLDKSWAHCKSQFNGVDAAKLTGKTPWGVTLDAASLAMAGDLHEHLGQLIAYARSVGVKPPWSK